MLTRINPQIIGVGLLGLIIISGSFLISQKNKASQKPEAQIAVVEENTDTVDQIETIKDVTNQEPEDIPIIPYVPKYGSDTFTERFLEAQYQKTLELEAVQGNPNELTEQALQLFAEETKDTLYTKDDIILHSTLTQDAFRTYGNQVAEAIISHSLPQGTRNEIDIINDASENEDETILEELTPIISMYQNVIDDLLLIEVPVLYIQQHLNLINTLNALLVDITAMRNTTADPLNALLRRERYYGDAIGFNTAIDNIYTLLHTAGIEWTESDIASQFISIEES